MEHHEHDLRKMRKVLQRLFPHNNKRTVAPPGILSKRVGKPILVSSLMRSGTHLLIDLLLNNFAEYRNTPLYIDLDQYLTKRLPTDQLLSCGSYVIKTHFPQTTHAIENISIIKKIASQSYILQPQREIESIANSLQKFSYSGTFEDLLLEKHTFEDFWKGYPVHHIFFHDLLDKDKGKTILEGIESFISQPFRNPPILPPLNTSISHIYVIKLLTRLFGKKSPIINTTIQFSK